MTENANSNLYLTKLLSCYLNLIKFLFLMENTSTFLSLLLKYFCPQILEQVKHFIQERENTEREAKTEEGRNVKQEGSTGTRAHYWVGSLYLNYCINYERICITSVNCSLSYVDLHEGWRGGRGWGSVTAGGYRIQGAGSDSCGRGMWKRLGRRSMWRLQRQW